MKKIIYIFIFMFIFFMFLLGTDLTKVKALGNSNILSGIKDNGSSIPALYSSNYYLNTCNKSSSAYSYSCFYNYANKTDSFRYIVFKPTVGNYSYVAMVLSDYIYSKTSSTSTTLRYIGNFNRANNKYLYYRYHTSTTGTFLQFHNADTISTGSTAFTFTAGLSINDMNNNVVTSPDTFYISGYTYSLFTYLGYNSTTSSWEFIDTAEFVFMKNYVGNTTTNRLNILASSWDIYDETKTNIVTNKTNIISNDITWKYVLDDDKVNVDFDFIKGSDVNLITVCDNNSNSCNFEPIDDDYILKDIGTNEDITVSYYDSSSNIIFERSYKFNSFNAKKNEFIDLYVENNSSIKGKFNFNIAFNDSYILDNYICKYTIDGSTYNYLSCLDDVDITINSNSSYTFYIDDINETLNYDIKTFNILYDKNLSYFDVFSTYDKQKFKQEIKIVIKNFDINNNYTLFYKYGVSSTEWTSLAHQEINYLYVNQTSYLMLKLVDSNNNIIATYSGSILYKTSNNNDIYYDVTSNATNGLNGKITQFLKPINFIFDRLTDLYNMFPDKVQDYFFVGFLFSVVIMLFRILF